jgi:hypothetical protein
MRFQIRDPESFCPGIQDGTIRIRDLGSGINMQPTEKITNIPLDTVPYALDIKKPQRYCIYCIPYSRGVFVLFEDEGLKLIRR